MVLVKMLQKYGKYNEGEVITLVDHVAEQWCGDVNRNFRVASRLPDEEAQKYLSKPPADKMVSVDDKGNAQDGRGRPKTKG